MIYQCILFYCILCNKERQFYIIKYIQVGHNYVIDVSYDKDTSNFINNNITQYEYKNLNIKLISF